MLRTRSTRRQRFAPKAPFRQDLTGIPIDGVSNNASAQQPPSHQRAIEPVRHRHDLPDPAFVAPQAIAQIANAAFGLVQSALVLGSLLVIGRVCKAFLKAGKAATCFVQQDARDHTSKGVEGGLR